VKSNNVNTTGATPPYWKSMEVSNTGLLTILFSELFVVPNITINATVLQVTLIPYGYQDPGFYMFNWTLASFT
jgi:hypothetical protein